MADITHLASCLQDGVTRLRVPPPQTFHAENFIQLQSLSLNTQAVSSVGAFSHPPAAAAAAAAAPRPLLYEELFATLLPDDTLAAAKRGELDFTQEQCNGILAALAMSAIPEEAVDISPALMTAFSLADKSSYTSPVASHLSSLAARQQAVAKNPSEWISKIKDEAIARVTEFLFADALIRIEHMNAGTWERAKKNAIHISFPICDTIEERNKKIQEITADVQAAFDKFQCNAAAFLVQGTATISRLIRGVSKSRYSHVALVVRVDGKLRMWQAAGGKMKSGAGFPGHEIADGFEAEAGPALHSLELFLHEYFKGYPDGQMVVRPLRIPIGETPQTFIDHMIQIRKDNVQFPSEFEMGWMWLMSQDLPIIRTLCKLIKLKHKIFDEIDPKDEKVKKMFCAGAVADAYINLGVMSSEKNIASYAPHAFGAQLDQATEIKLRDAWLFGDESFIDFKKSN